jgi:phage terminase large subunit GpA-like protein
MRSLKVLCVFLSVVALGSMVMAGSKNSMGIHEVNNVTFVAPVRIGTVLLPAGEYVVRHVMDQQDHIMVFKSVQGKDEVKVKCTLVPLAKKADRSEEIYKVNAKNERELQELVFRGDTSKHVF